MAPARQSICIVIVTGKFVAIYVHWGSILMDIFGQFKHLMLPTVSVVKIVSWLNCQLLFQAADKPDQRPNTFPDGEWETSCPHLPQPRMTERSTMWDVFWPIWKRVCWFALYNYVRLVVCVWKGGRKLWAWEVLCWCNKRLPLFFSSLSSSFSTTAIPSPTWLNQPLPYFPGSPEDKAAKVGLSALVSLRANGKQMKLLE